MQCPAFEPRQPENELPDVLFCGTSENNVPKIAIGNSKEKKKRPGSPNPNIQPQPNYDESLADVDMHDKILSHQINMNNKRYMMQDELHNKDRNCEYIQRKVCCLQNEVKLLSDEYSALSFKLSKSRQKCPYRGAHNQKNSLCTQQTQTETSNVDQLEKEAEIMEEEMEKMMKKVVEIEREHAILEEQRKCERAKMATQEITQLDVMNENPRPLSLQPMYYRECAPYRPDFVAAVDFHLRMLHQQYQRLCYEITCLKEDSVKFKCMCNSTKEAAIMAMKRKPNKIRKSSTSSSGSSGSRKSSRDKTENPRTSFPNTEREGHSFEKTHQPRNSATGTRESRTPNYN